MTLLDLFRLIRKYWIIVVAVTVVCGGAAGAYAMMSRSVGHSATAAIVGNSQAGGVMGFANAEGRMLIDPESDYKMEAKVEAGTSTVNVTVSGPDEKECISLANSLADRALDRAVEAYEGFENPFSGTVEKADITEEVKSGSGKKYLLVGILAGLFLGVCIVVIIDMVRRPVKSIEGMQDLVELPVLEKLPATNGERLLANVRFASKKDDLRRVCVVPLGDRALADEVAALLDAAMAAEVGQGSIADNSSDVRSGDNAAQSSTSVIAKEAIHDRFFVQACDPLSAGMSAAYEARGADAVIVAGRQWTDSLSALETTVAELQLAEANVVGLVFAK